MKLDKNTLDMLGKLNDDALWMMIKTVAASSGLKIGDQPADMNKLRSLLSTLTEDDLTRAAELLSNYKNQQ